MRLQFSVWQYAQLVGRLARKDWDRYGLRGIGHLAHYIAFVFIIPTAQLWLGLGGRYEAHDVPLLNTPAGASASTVRLYVHRPYSAKPWGSSSWPWDLAWGGNSSAAQVRAMAPSGSLADADARSRAAVLLISGMGGGVTGPGGVFVTAARQLSARGITTIRLDYNAAAQMPECEADVDAAIAFLTADAQAHGHAPFTRIGIAGWSFGGSVAIRAGGRHGSIKAVAGLAPMPHGAGAVGRLSSLGKPLLIVHGSEDSVLPVEGSLDLFSRAGQPKELVVYPGDNHGLSWNRHDLYTRLVAFMEGTLVGGSRSTETAGAPHGAGHEAPAAVAAWGDSAGGARGKNEL